MDGDLAEGQDDKATLQWVKGSEGEDRLVAGGEIDLRMPADITIAGVVGTPQSPLYRHLTGKDDIDNAAARRAVHLPPSPTTPRNIPPQIVKELILILGALASAFGYYSQRNAR